MINFTNTLLIRYFSGNNESLEIGQKRYRHASAIV
jgi:hypothetical protein